MNHLMEALSELKRLKMKCILCIRETISPGFMSSRPIDAPRNAGRASTTYGMAIRNDAVGGLLVHWNDRGYISQRQHLQEINFSPCTYCNSCEMVNTNLKDCYGDGASLCGLPESTRINTKSMKLLWNERNEHYA